MPVPNARFHELLKDIEPSATTTAQASSAHTPDGPCDTALRYESPHPPRDRKGFPEWQSFAPPQRDRPAATVVYFCTAAYNPTCQSSFPPSAVVDTFVGAAGRSHVLTRP